MTDKAHCNILAKLSDLVNLLSGVVVLLTGLVIFYLIRSYRKKRELNVLLDQKVKERSSELESTREELTTYIREKEALFTDHGPESK